MHVSLDGFVAGPNGEIDWINVEDELFELVGEIVDQADTAVYGRITFQMMEAYWPKAGDKPNASKHDIEHSNWANKAYKIVASHTLTHSDWQNTHFLNNDIPEGIDKYKKTGSKAMLILGSPSLVHQLAPLGMIDEYWLGLNPMILGRGIPLFKNIESPIPLKLDKAIPLNSGVTMMHYLRSH